MCKRSIRFKDIEWIIVNYMAVNNLYIKKEYCSHGKRQVADLNRETAGMEFQTSHVKRGNLLSTDFN